MQVFSEQVVCHTDLLMTLRTLIADDEALARDLLANWVRQDPRLRLAGQAQDGEEVLDFLSKTPVDLVFLDIQMPCLDGLEVLKTIRSRGLNTYVVFVTAYSRHAVSAFDLAAGDYLVKPLRKTRFELAVRRAGQALRQRAQLDASTNSLEPLMVREGGRMTALNPARIVWVEAASQYARLHTDKQNYLVSRPLAEVEAELPEQLFARVHRSALVNLACVRHVCAKEGNYSLELSNGQHVPVARSRRAQVMNLIRKAAGGPGV